jgi:hypothetical protein
MSFLKKPLRRLKDFGSSSDVTDTTDSTSSVPSKAEGLNGNGKNTPSASSTPLAALNGNSLKLALNGALGGSPKRSGSGRSTPEDSRRQSREILRAEKQQQAMEKERKKKETKLRETMARIEDEKFLREGPPQLTKLYKPFSMNMSKTRGTQDRVLFKEIDFKGTPISTFTRIFC